MNYVIIDMEFNNLEDITELNSDLIFNNEDIINKKKVCPQEIIEIGAIKLDKSLKEIDKFKLYVKPTIYPFLNPRIKEMTGITEEHLSNGIYFSEAVEKLKEFVDEDSIVCTWAKDDIVALIRNSNYHNCGSIEWIKAYFDIQEYCTKVLASKNPMSLKKAIKRFNLKVDEKELHDALVDSIYTGEVLKRIYNFRAIKNSIVKDIDKMPSAIIEVEEELSLKEKAQLICPACGMEVEEEYPFKTYKGRLMGVFYCAKCDHRISQEIMVVQNLIGDKLFKEKKKILSEEALASIINKLERIS